MSIKKFLSTLGILLFAVVSLVTFTACKKIEINNANTNINTSNTTNHIHQYDNGKIITHATCTQNGTKKYTCSDSSCAHSYTESYTLTQYTATELYNQSVKYVGEIVTYDQNGAKYALGTGFVISADGKIVTNYHVIKGAYSADITINDIKYSVISVLAYDPNIDLAILKIDASGLIAATICKLPVGVGSTVYAIGSSRGMTNTYSQGIVTYANRIVNGVSHVQHDASITHGNSGGPLINIYGEVIGINTWVFSDSQNLNFAIFVDELDNLVYNTPLTIAELTKLDLSHYQALASWICDNATNTDDDRYTFYDESPSGTLYGISYCSDGSITISSLDISEKSKVWSVLAIKENNNYADCGLIVDQNDTNQNIGEMYGKINISIYNYGDHISHSQFYGSSEIELNIENLYQTSIQTNIEWLRIFLDAIKIDITLNDLGFTEYKYP